MLKPYSNDKFLVRFKKLRYEEASNNSYIRFKSIKKIDYYNSLRRWLPKGGKVGARKIAKKPLVVPCSDLVYLWDQVMVEPEQRKIDHGCLKI